MNREKTGALIAATRKEKHLTQKELAQLLHVSDRAVSKWERGAGFPDVSLLEPLAAALGLHVLDLLRGERTEEEDIHAAVGEALAAFQEKQCRDRKKLRRDLRILALYALVIGLLFSLCGWIWLPVNRTENACVYRDGEPVAVTEVRLEGRIFLRPWMWTYRGRFATSWAPGSTWEGLTVGLDYRPWNGELLRRSTRLDTSKGWIRGEVMLDAYCISPLLREFAVRTETGDIIATTPEMYQALVQEKGGADLKKIPFSEPELTDDPRAQYDGGYPPHV